MATVVQDIVNNSRTVISAQLGDTWQELRHWYDVTKADYRSGTKGYNVRPLDASEDVTVNRFYTVDQGFELILVDTVARAQGDTERETVLFEMYNQIDEIFKDLVNTKINGTTNVLLVNGPNISEPEFLDENKFVVLRMQYTVKYRGATS